MLYMRSAEEDRTARAVIRDEALRLFAAHGPDAVTVRQIAAAAGVSPALVVHHFGSKEGLREAVDQHVLGLFEALIGEMTAEGAPDLYDPAATGSLAEAIVRHLPPGSPVPGYLRRLLLADGAAGRQLFRRLYQMSTALMDSLVRAGLADPGADPASGSASCWPTTWPCCCCGSTWRTCSASTRCPGRAWPAGPARSSRSTPPACRPLPRAPDHDPFTWQRRLGDDDEISRSPG